MLAGVFGCSFRGLKWLQLINVNEMISVFEILGLQTEENCRDWILKIQTYKDGDQNALKSNQPRSDMF